MTVTDVVAEPSIWLSLYRTPHRLGFVDAGGYRTRYLEAGRGDAEVVVLLHGTAGSLENFSRNVAAYAEHFRVIALDLAGCGWTDKPQAQLTIHDWVAHVLAVLDVLGIERASFVGVSLGSVVAVNLTQRAPERVNRVVMVAPVGVALPEGVLQGAVTDIAKRRLKAAESLTWSGVRAIFERLFLRSDRIIDDLVAVRLEIYSDPEMQRAMPLILVSSATEGILSDEDWRAFPRPLQVIASVDAPNIFLDSAYRIGDLAPDVDLVELPDCDHWAQFECAAEFNATSIEFLTRGPA